MITQILRKHAEDMFCKTEHWWDQAMKSHFGPQDEFEAKDSDVIGYYFDHLI